MVKGRRWAKWALCVILVLGLGLSPWPREAVGLVRRGDALRAGREYGAAVEHYREAAELWPVSPTPLLRMGLVYLEQGRSSLAEEFFSQAKDFPQVRGRALAGLAEAHWGKGEREKAIVEWREAVALRPFDLEIRYRLGRAYLSLSRWREAEEELRAIVAMVGEGRASYRRGALYHLGLMLAGEEPEEAEAYLREVVGPEDELSRTAEEVLSVLSEAEEPAQRALGLGLAYLRRGEWSLAERELARALELDPSYAEAYSCLGYVRFRLGKPSLELLQRGVRMAPDSALSHYFLGLRYRASGLWELAIAEMERARELDPDNAAFCLELAQTYREAGDYAEAEKWLKEAVGKEPYEAEFRLALARFYVEQFIKVEEEGLPAAEEAVRLAPHRAEAYDILGWAYYLTGRWEEAERALKRALALDPYLAGAHYHLGGLYALKGDKASAHWHYQRAVDLDFGGFYGKRAEGALRVLSEGQ